MKLYYDVRNDKIVEAGKFKQESYSRDDIGDVKTEDVFKDLVLIGDIYSEPIKLPRSGRLELKKIEGDKSYVIIHGYCNEEKIQEGLRFAIQGRGFISYNTNIVVAAEEIDDKRIEFYTLSGSHYSIEILEEK